MVSRLSSTKESYFIGNMMGFSIASGIMLIVMPIRGIDDLSRHPEVISEKHNKKHKNFLLANTRKYPLRGYILGVLTHTTAWDRHWGGDETLKLVLVYVIWLLLS